MASLTDKITDVRNAARPNSARVSSPRSSGGTTLACDNLVGWPTASKVHFVTYQIDSSSNPVAGTQLDCEGIVSGNNIGSFTVIDGTDNGNSTNDVVEMLPTAAWGQDLADALTAEHDRTGKHTAITATSANVTGTVSADTIAEHTAAAGVTIDGLLLKDGHVDNGGVLGAVRTYTSSDTWTKPSGLNFVIVEVQGGGGAAGGTAATNGSQWCAGDGGGAGAYARKKVLTASLGSTETVTVGAAGVGVSGTSGGNGGNSSFGSHCTANGGTGGSTSGAASTAAGGYGSGGAGSSTATGDLTVIGGDGGGYVGNPVSNFNVCYGGAGGASYFGGGGRSGVANSSGNAGRAYGSGGGAGGRATSQSASTGASGAAGIVIVYEYY